MDTEVDKTAIAVENGADIVEKKEPTAAPKKPRLSKSSFKHTSGVLHEYPFLRAAPILGNELCERLAYYGIQINIVVYLTQVLNVSNSSASALINAWSGTCYITPLIGAWLADSWWGRYWVIFSFSLVYMAGLVLMSLSAGVPSLTPPAGQEATGSQMAVFWTGMYLIALGTGGIKPCVSTFGADQFNENDPREVAFIPRFYNWFYAFVNIGAVVSSTLLVWVQTDVSWAVGFAIPAGAFLVSLVIFVSFSWIYRHAPPGGSPFNRWYKVVRGSIRHRKRAMPEDRAELHDVEGIWSVVPGQMKMVSTPEYACLDKAAVKEGAPGEPDKYLVTITEVEELKCVVRLLPICLTMCVYNAEYAQMSTLFVIQGMAMDCAIGSWSIPPAMLSVLDCLGVLFWVPMYDLVLAPACERWGFPISRLVRIGIGFVIGSLSMVAGGVVEQIRLSIVARHNLQDVDPSIYPNTVPMSVFWQVPQYFLIGMSEVFALVGALEFFYSQSPEAMRAIASALNLVCNGIGSYLSTALVAIVGAITTSDGRQGWIADNTNQGHINYFFYLLAVLMWIFIPIYVWICYTYRYRQTVEYIPEKGGAPNLSRLSSRISVNRRLSRKSFIPPVHGYEMVPNTYTVHEE